jgi:NAD(P)-dependent dehydrogenase (short-subunit alcohol dehydrogenase family)
MMAQIPNEERKTLILTGASRGIGHATVKRFSSAGWRVITCSHRAFSEDCPWEVGPKEHIQVDLADPGNTLEAIKKERLRAQGGRLNALVNNAAISPKSEGGARLGTIDTAHRDWLTVIQVNFFAPLMLGRGLIDELEAASGAVVNVSSIARSRVHPFAGSAYATSKAALAVLTREVAADFAPRGIRVNAISPGEIDTAILSPGTEKLIADSNGTARAARGGGQGDLFPLHRAIELYQRHRALYRRRTARLIPLAWTELKPPFTLPRQHDPRLCRPVRRGSSSLYCVAGWRHGCGWDAGAEASAERDHCRRLRRAARGFARAIRRSRVRRSALQSSAQE